MVDLKQAAEIASVFASDLLQAQDVLLEEVQRSTSTEGQPVWKVTVSLPKRIQSHDTQDSFGAKMATLLGKDRDYKVVIVNRESGEVESIRERKLVAR